MSNEPLDSPSIGTVNDWTVGVVPHPPSTVMLMLTVSTRFPVFTKLNGNVKTVPGTAARESGAVSWTS